MTDIINHSQRSRFLSFGLRSGKQKVLLVGDVLPPAGLFAFPSHYAHSAYGRVESAEL